jgi:hypothetical protein
MRTLVFISCLIIAGSLNAQTMIPGSLIDNSYRGSLVNRMHVNDSAFDKKWSVSKYAGLSTSFSFFKGGNATVFSAPLGLQLNRRLNNNLFAFAGASIAPSYINFRSSFLNADFSKTGRNNSFSQSGLGIYSRAELGLQYINDDRTFSISGSIGIERSDFPTPFVPYNNRTNQNIPLRRY